MHHLTDRIAHTTAFDTPVVENWLEREIAYDKFCLLYLQGFQQRVQAVHRPDRERHAAGVQGGDGEPAAHPRQVPLPVQPARLLPRHHGRAAVHPRHHGGARLHEEALGAWGNIHRLTDTS